MLKIAGAPERRISSGVLVGSSAVVQIEYRDSITAVDELLQPAETRHFIAPGFIDVQVNGFAGVDYNDPAASHEAIAASLGTMFRTGVTRCFPTIVTAPEERICAALRNLTSAKEEFRRSGLSEHHAIAGFHIEGPHISAESGPRGAHIAEYVRPPDYDEFQRWQQAADGHVRLVTISPEWETAPDYIRRVVGSGTVASIGHTKATTAQIQAAVDAGATMSTHLGNAAHPTLPKIQNYIWDQLAQDRLTASFIADGIHLPAEFLRAALRAKGIDRCVLVTDAVMPAMCAPGAYQLGSIHVELRSDGSVRLAGGSRLAGSVLRMDEAIGNAVRLGGISLSQAVAMATVNAARVARIASRRRGLAPGEAADLVRFTFDESSSSVSIIETVVAGTTVYNA